MSDPTATAGPARRKLRWRWVAWRAGPAVILLVAFSVPLFLVPWIPLFPHDLGRRLTEWFLRGLLIGYAATLSTALLGIFGLALYVLHGRRRRLARPLAARLWLLSASALIGLAGVELSASIWLEWLHRLPVLPTRFSGPSPPGVTSVVSIGGSSARGFPYHPWLSVGQIVAWQLEKATPGRRFDIDVRAHVGADLEQMHQGLAKLTRRPDILIIYVGHNEFLTRYDGAREAGLQEVPVFPVLDRLYRLSLNSALCRLIYETVSKNRLGGPPPLMRQHHLIDPPCVTPSEYAAIVADFHRRLEAIVAYCDRIGCVPVLVIPPGNEAGFEPNRSVLADTTSKAERARVTHAFEATRAREGAGPVEALAAYLAILFVHPEFAEAHFRAGRLLERMGKFAEANRQYIEARECDGYPVRCPSPFQEVYRAVARRHNAILVDGLAVLRSITSHGILDDDAFHDGHHPTLAGHVALAQAILDALYARRVRGPNRSPAPVVDLVETAAHFEIDREKWLAVCERSANHYGGFALARYDRTERLAKQKIYEEAGRKIARGVPPGRPEFQDWVFRRLGNHELHRPWPGIHWLAFQLLSGHCPPRLAIGFRISAKASDA